MFTKDLLISFAVLIARKLLFGLSKLNVIGTIINYLKVLMNIVLICIIYNELILDKITNRFKQYKK
jgi:hypothetical protein